jgi:hypothetical protein
MRFRESRGTLADAMETVAELPPTRPALVGYLQNLLKTWPTAPPVTLETVRVEPYAYDPRNNWGCTYIVTLDGYGVLGFTDWLV